MGQRNPDEVGALWRKTSAKGGDYLSGTVNGVAVVCFPNNHKQGREPDWRVLKARPAQARAQDAPDPPQDW